MEVSFTGKLMVFLGAVNRTQQGVQINFSTCVGGAHLHCMPIRRRRKPPQPLVFTWSLKKHGDQRLQALRVWCCSLGIPRCVRSQAWSWGSARPENECRRTPVSLNTSDTNYHHFFRSCRALHLAELLIILTTLALVILLRKELC